MDKYSLPEELEKLEAVQYAQQIARGEVIAGKYIICECVRFVNDLKRQEDDDFEWYFDIGTYEFIEVFQSLFKFADGISAGKTMKLAMFQMWILGNIFCWKHKEEGYVRFSKAYIQVARKQGKSALLAFFGIIKSLLDEYSQIFCCATKKDQAEIVIKEMKKLLDKALPDVKERFEIYGKAKISKIMCTVTQSELAPLSADANTLDGLGVDFFVKSSVMWQHIKVNLLNSMELLFI